MISNGQSPYQEISYRKPTYAGCEYQQLQYQQLQYQRLQASPLLQAHSLEILQLDTTRSYIQHGLWAILRAQATQSLSQLVFAANHHLRTREMKLVGCAPRKYDFMYLRIAFDKYMKSYLRVGFGKYDFMYLRIDFANDCNYRELISVLQHWLWSSTSSLPVGFGKYDFMYLRIDFANDCNVGRGTLRHHVFASRLWKRMGTTDFANDCNVGDGWERYLTDEMDVTPSKRAKTTRRGPARGTIPSRSAAVKAAATIAEAAQQQPLSSGSSPEEIPAPIVAPIVVPVLIHPPPPLNTIRPQSLFGNVERKPQPQQPRGFMTNHGMNNHVERFPPVFCSAIWPYTTRHERSKNENIYLNVSDGKYDFMYLEVGFASTTLCTCGPTLRTTAMSGAVAA
ncbi:uncharacterized protein NECHADRAFT_79634 [Fusarium vanettenii 77-13-4]|uniref:Uncharacterized protein n=1 Tax=Fusarium vanettenii (strain ATCC MYA-4622 / CBS 123669 / FGSC 9596 / NRRL 45880 / 77-13-4) TaxID=660122 RepID=C7Z819_FUSV7|nr:uncharacterized protein NECHADRAFT_79634 [Fusarium vanettenii 77-13-4]EEU39924.1 predicted protein [Fusarium vanettenii 77-13-4]